MPEEVRIKTWFDSLVYGPGGNSRRDVPLVLVELRSLPMPRGIRELRSHYGDLSSNIKRIFVQVQQKRVLDEDHQRRAESIAWLAAQPAMIDGDRLVRSVSHLRALLPTVAINVRVPYGASRMELLATAEQLARIGSGARLSPDTERSEPV